MNKLFVRSGSSRHILLVAADSNFRTSSVSALCDAGYCADGEGDAEVAWETLCRHGYELLVVDHQLPVSSGLRLVLRMHHANLTLPVILVTEGSFLFDPLTHGGLHAVTLLPKPFDVARLIEVVQLTFQCAPATNPVRHRLALTQPGTPAPHRVARGALKTGPRSRKRKTPLKTK